MVHITFSEFLSNLCSYIWQNAYLNLQLALHSHTSTEKLNKNFFGPTLCFSTKIYLILALLGLLNYKIYIWNLQDPLDSWEKKRGSVCREANLSISASQMDLKTGSCWLAWRISLSRRVVLQNCDSSAAMHLLRTTVVRLWPLTAVQMAQSLSKPVPLAVKQGLRTSQPARHLNTPLASEPFLNGTSSNYVEEMYYTWLENPKSVHKVQMNLILCLMSLSFLQLYMFKIWNCM